MEGFFSKKETESETRPGGKVLTCASCGLSTGCDFPKMEACGEGKKKILIIGECNTHQDDRDGGPLRGKAGCLLESHLKELGINLWEDCKVVNAVRCYPGQKEFTSYNVDCCRKNILHLISVYKPELIIPLGVNALYSTIGHVYKKPLGKFEKWRGFTIPLQSAEAWVCPVWHPDYVYQRDYPEVKVIWNQDLERAINKINDVFPVHKEPKVEIITNLSVLDEISPEIYNSIAFDYETTGLKPYTKGHRVVCASVAVRDDCAYAFMMPNNREERQPFVNLLQDPDMGKMAHNMKFEDTWSNIRLRTEVNGWEWDSMIAAHVLDNRRGITGLKFQMFINFGLPDYDDEVTPYLKGVGDDSNSINRIQEFLQREDGEEILLRYCAFDSAYQFKLGRLQQSIIHKDKDLTRAYNLLHEGILSLAKAERQGLCVDIEYCQNQKERLLKRITRLEKKFKATDFYIKWDRTTKGTPNIDSPLQLGNYLYTTLKLKPFKETPTGGGSTNEESLRFLKIPALDLFLDIKRLKTALGTFLEGLMREAPDGHLHPFFNLHLVTSYRSSSDSPNFQNFPKRDKEIMALIRTAIRARPGHQLMEFDFSGLEVAIACCYHKDPTMVKYLAGHGDLHGDMAKQIFKIAEFNRGLPDHDALRWFAKSGFVFPQFYGDYFKANAINICQYVDLPMKSWKGDEGMKLTAVKPLALHMKEQGIGSFNKFVEHIKGIEEHFWGKRFPVYASWKEKQVKRYQRQGVVRSLTGFGFTGVMKKNELINYPVQGAAFHCLLWSFTEVSKEITKRGLKTRLVGQIHDSMVLDIYPPELKEITALVNEVTTVRLPKAFTWINIPLSIDAEIAPVDGTWAEMEEYKF